MSLRSLALLSMALLSLSCHALGASRGAALLLASITGLVAWLAHRGHARAGGGTAGTTTDTTGPGSPTGTASGDATGADASTDTGTTTAPMESTDEGFTVGPCLSKEPPSESSSSGEGSSTGEDPEFTVCLCACETNQDGSDWAPALLLPVVARRRRRRRDSLEHIASQGRLPSDVVDRLRARLGE